MGLRRGIQAILISLFLRATAAQYLWVVTESGRIQQQLESPFVLRRPYDLLAFLEQDARWNEMKAINEELLRRKTVIDEKWSGLESASELISRVYAQVEDCMMADKLLTEMDLYESFGMNGTELNDLKDFVLEDVDKVHKKLQPDCSQFMDLEFSMFAYEHLQSMVNRSGISIKPESLLEQLMPVESVDDFGSRIAIALSKNRTSWFHYNLAVLFWRIKGDAFRAIECARRSLYSVPRAYRLIPLTNLAAIFHHSRIPSDALILLHAALDHTPRCPELFRYLGDVYTSISEYGRAIVFYDGALELRSDWQLVRSKRFAVLCHRKLEAELMDLHETLQGILSDLHEYHGRQQHWLRLQDKLLYEKMPLSVQLSRYSPDKLNGPLHRAQRCVRRGDDDSTISCDFLDAGGYVTSDFQVDAAENLQRLLLSVESETKKISQQILFGKQDEAVKVESSDKVVRMSKMEMPEVKHERYPASTSSSMNLYFDVPGWPSKENCLKWDMPINDYDDLDLPIFLPPDNKGYQVDLMLGEYIDLPKGSEHELPWYPPVCEFPEKQEGVTRLTNLVKRLQDRPLEENDYLKAILKRYVNDGRAEMAEIGQRIVAAMKKKSGPDWVLAVMASLYWRVRANAIKAFDCLEVAFQKVPKEIADTVLVSFASLLQQHGMIEDAIRYATIAYKTNHVEPSTNFLLGLLFYPKNNPVMAMYYMKNCLRADPGFYNGLAEKLLKTWACRDKLVSPPPENKNNNANSNKQKEKIDKRPISSEGVICSANGEQCKTATIQCFAGGDGSDGGKGKRLPLSSCRQVSNGAPVASVISSMISSHEDGSGKIEPDQSQLESVHDTPLETIHMRISVDETVEFPFSGFGAKDGEDSLHFLDSHGIFPLTGQACRELKEMDWSQSSSMWQPFASRNVDISRFMKPLPKAARDLKPYCREIWTTNFDHLASMMLRRQLPNYPDSGLKEWLGLVAGDRRAAVSDLGAKIAVAMKENTSSWILATSAALYWRIVGNTLEAVTCLRNALQYVPEDMQDIPLTSLANLLHRIGSPGDALEVAMAALNTRVNFVITHFTIGNIYSTIGDMDKAINFYRSALVVDPNFEPARTRMKLVVCKMLFGMNLPEMDSGYYTGM